MDKSRDNMIAFPRRSETAARADMRRQEQLLSETLDTMIAEYLESRSRAWEPKGPLDLADDESAAEEESRSDELATSITSMPATQSRHVLFKLQLVEHELARAAAGRDDCAGRALAMLAGLKSDLLRMGLAPL
jgi:hypothetical protein